VTERATFVLVSDRVRNNAVAAIRGAPDGARVEVKAPRRSVSQNSAMWAALTDVATQVRWHGLTLDTSDWKLLFLDALKRENRMVPNLDNNGFVSLGRSSSDLTKEEMSDLIELIHAFGSNHGVVFHDTERQDA
jgi:hypothetical protein